MGIFRRDGFGDGCQYLPDLHKRALHVSERLKELFVSYVILGHSERREYFAESDAFINEKVKCTLEYGMRPILCVGETDVNGSATNPYGTKDFARLAPDFPLLPYAAFHEHEVRRVDQHHPWL